MNKRVLRRVAFGCLCFVAPIVMLCVVCARGGIYPFGQQTFLSEDLLYQYRDFYEWYIRVLNGEASVLYDPNTGMGTNAWGIYSYYLASPVNLLLPFFGGDRITLFVFVATALKLGCMCSTMAWYLRRRFGLWRTLAFALAMCFTCSTWSITQMRNPQWLDALILLPLMAWSVYVLIRDRRCVPLVVTIVCAVVTCWYTAYMLLAFLFLFFAMEAIAVTAHGVEARLVLRCFGLLVICVATGLALSAVTFLPTVLQMLGTNAPATAPMTVDAAWREVLSGTVIFGWQRDARPQLFGGTLLLVLLFALPFVRSVPLRVRVTSVLSAVFLMMGTQNAGLQLAWSGFRPTMGFYNRMSWLFVFCLVWAGAWVFRALQDKVARPWVLVAGGCGACLWTAMVYVLCSYDYAPGVVITGACVLCGVACLLFVLKRRGTLVGSVCCALFCLLVCGDLAWSCLACVGTLYVGPTQSSVDDAVKQSRRQAMELKQYDSTWYRADKTYSRVGYAARNEGMAFGYNALSTYCSSQNGRAVAFLERMGYSRENEFSVSYTDAIPVMDSMLGVRYVSSDECPAGYVDVGLMSVDADVVCELCSEGTRKTQARFYQNSQALPIAYGASRDVIDAGYVGEDNAFEEQNTFVARVLGHDAELYTPLTAVLVEEGNGRCVWDVTVPAGYIGYARTTRMDDACVLTISGRAQDDNYHWRHAITQLVDARGHEQTVRVVLERMGGSNSESALRAEDSCLFYALDWDAHVRAMSEIALRQAQVVQSTAGNVVLDYESDEDGDLLVSLPNEPGWSVTVNGQSVSVGQAYDGALMIIPVCTGLNHVELSFVPRGLVVGCAVSAMALAACLVVKRSRPRVA